MSMLVDKAWEEWKEGVIGQQDDIDFANSKFEFEFDEAVAFSGGFTAGQKILSPEVRECLELVKGFIESGNKYSLECGINIIDKLLEAGE